MSYNNPMADEENPDTYICALFTQMVTAREGVEDCQRQGPTAQDQVVVFPDVVVLAPGGLHPGAPDIPATPEQVALCQSLYVLNCGGCHGMYGSIPMLPDLRRMSPEKHELFREIVLGGMLESVGISSFAGDLSEQDVDAIQAYIVSEARAAIARQSR